MLKKFKKNENKVYKYFSTSVDHLLEDNDKLN